MATNFAPIGAPSGHQTVFDGDEAIYLQTDPLGVPGDKYTTPADFQKNYLYVYKLSVSIASNNLTVAIVDLDGNAASATNPIRVRIGDVEHTLSAALSVTAAAGTKWFNSGGDELKTKSVGYFVYLGYNATDGVVIGFARFPWARKYSDFNTTGTNEKYCKISTITTAGANDVYQNIGYFEATLSAAAEYTWSSATNVISEQKFESNVMDWTPTHTRLTTGYTNAPTTNSAKYQISGRRVLYEEAHTQNATPGGSGIQQLTLPCAPARIIPNPAMNVTQIYSMLSWAFTTPGYVRLVKYDATAEATASEQYYVSGMFEW